MRYYLGVMETNIALASLPAPRNLAITNIFAGVENDAKRNFYILSSLLLPALSKAVLRETESAAWLRLAVVALAIEKFKKSEGHFPENLEDLVPKFLPDLPVDPFDGATLRYRLIEKGYLIYSVGTDGRDDGGLGKSAEQKLSDKTPFDITFTVER
jgi:type II secretory pathway pseudopilin PulG